MNFLNNKLTLFLLALFMGHSAMAEIVCFTPRMSKKIVIKENGIAISKPLLDNLGERSVASLQAVRTKYMGTGFDKVAFHQGQKNVIHIENTNSFSEVDDYLLIRSVEGHEMIYPLTCQ